MKQNKIVCLLAMLSVLLISQSMFAQEQGSRQKSSAAAKADLVYQCENDLGVIANKAGSCSKCGSKLIALTMDEAMDNLSGKKDKKPELKVTSVYSVKREKVETHNDVEIVESDEESAEDEEESSELEEESSEHNHAAEHEKKVMMTDMNRDGLVYQCPNCPGNMSDKLDDCEECFKIYLKVSVEEAKKNVPVCNH